MRLAIMEPITNETVNKVVHEVLLSKANRRDPTIYVYLNSPGGDVDAGYAIYETLRLSGKNIITYAANNVFSCAVIIYLAGELRFANEYSNFMIHEPYHEICGEGSSKLNLDEYKKSIDDLTTCIDGYIKLITKRTGLSAAKIKKYIKDAPDGDWYFKTDLAIKLGIVHHIGMP